MSRATTPRDQPSTLGAALQPPAVTVPKGGGAIRGIGEKFAANPVTGTGSLTVPIATSPGRSGFGLELMLRYDSGNGNGPFGLGWSLSLPSITRKTDKGLPRYRDAEDSDVFMLSGAEDLVPVIDQATGLKSFQVRNGYRIERYRPRIEGLFLRIERWSRDGASHWRSISRDNVTTVYGVSGSSRIADPADDTRIFQWLVCERFDDKGNTVVYEYVREDSRKVDLTQAQERNRTPASRETNRYLKRVKYGNRVSRLDNPGVADRNWMFEVVFDYDEGHYSTVATQPGQHEQAQARAAEAAAWSVREDPFSSYRAGFEIRTYRLCRRVLLFHHFGTGPHGEPGYDGLVRATELTYSESPTATLLTSITQSGFKLVANDTYLRKPLPPLECGYTAAAIREDVFELDAGSSANIPYGLDGRTYQWIDLDGEGSAGVLTEQAGATFYKRNLSPAGPPFSAARGTGQARFGAVERVSPAPAGASGVRFLDLAGDGHLDVVDFDRPAAGFFERESIQGWATFRAFSSLPNLAWDDPSLRFVDLTGDGHADILLTDDEVFTWYPSLAEEGFGAAEHVRQPRDEELGPHVAFADAARSIYLADMSGDGLVDVVRIRNGEVCYWPNLGYGRFGTKVTMAGAPWFDANEHFDERRIRLADIDGSGVTDIVYIGRDTVTVYTNQSGNSWSGPYRIAPFPRVDSLSSVQALDLLGNGTACLVWSSALPADARAPVRYVKLMGDDKPYLLTSTTNNLGAETRVSYAPSTKFYVEDMLAGRPWITRLPFPVHVVARIESYDRISRNRHVTRYAYHHGYFDGAEREFRGFGLVEQWDTEEIGTIDDGAVEVPSNVDAASFVPPVYTRTWFHTGAYPEAETVSRHFAQEYYRSDETQLPDTELPSGPLSADEEREAVRALKGLILRQEMYAQDGSVRAGHPYTVSEHTYAIRVVQQRNTNAHGVFLTHPRETLSFQYERNPADPRVTHEIASQVDAFGNVERSVHIVYPRSNVPGRYVEQQPTHIALTMNWFINRDDQPDWYRAGLTAETRTYEIVKPPSAIGRFTFGDINALVTALVPVAARAPVSARTIPFEQWDWRSTWTAQAEPGGPANSRLRLLSHSRTLYRKNNPPSRANELLPLAQVESLALPGESYALALTSDLLSMVYRRGAEDLLPVADAVLRNEGGYVAGDDYRTTGLFPAADAPGQWWAPSGRTYLSESAADTPASEIAFARSNFFLARRAVNPFGSTSLIRYDGSNLLVVESEDAAGNKITAGERDSNDAITRWENDYRALQPRLVTDANRNRVAVAFDALGLVIGTAVMGKSTEQLGDTLAGYSADLDLSAIQAFVRDPIGQAPSLVGNASTRFVYDVDRFRRCAQPPLSATLTREMHVSDTYYSALPAGLAHRFQIGIVYSDGFGREAQRKVPVEAGLAPARQLNRAAGAAAQDAGPGALVRNANGALVLTQTDPRWVGTGRRVYNNKGRPVRRYEPFFSTTPLFEDEREIVETGVTSVFFYDPLERVVAALHASYAWEKVVFDAWRQDTWDVNDTVLLDPMTDTDVAPYFSRLPNAANFQTWYSRRIVGGPGTPERQAADKTATHGGTPSVAHIDPLGRSFLTIAHSRAAAGPDRFYTTRVTYDMNGNERRITDAKNRRTTECEYDMRRERVRNNAMDAGERWRLADVASNVIRGWDGRAHRFRTVYDGLRRVVRSFVQGADPQNPNREILFESMVYGEANDSGLSQSQVAAGNLRGKVYRHLDAAGVVTHVQYDFRGNLLRSSRTFVTTYTGAIDWAAAPPLEPEMFFSSTRYDALNRPVQLVAPHSNASTRCTVLEPAYNVGGLLERQSLWLHRPIEPQGLLINLTGAISVVTNVNYNARAQRESIDYGNGVSTTYEYDAATFRPVRLKTVRPSGRNGAVTGLFADNTIVQDLRCTYDPIGNTVAVSDDAVAPVVHNNQTVTAESSYTYDAVYRLVTASGREHIGQNAFLLTPVDGNRRDYPFVGPRAQSTDLLAVRRYHQTYEYDDVENLTTVTHVAQGGGWTRHYAYAPGPQATDRLMSTTVGNDVETYRFADSRGLDVHGCVTGINTMDLAWDFMDRLERVELGGGGRAYYAYDGAGQRVRKVIVRQDGTVQKQRFYLGGFEIYREYRAGGTSTTLERETLHVMDDQRRVAIVDTKTIDSAAPIAAANLRPLQRFQIANQLWSTAVELNDLAAVVSYEEYHPYGTTSFQVPPSGAETAAKRYRATGKERDEESGFFYHGARYYAPWIARWASPDPASDQSSRSLYSYVRGNPITFIDPDGAREAVPWPGATNMNKSQIIARARANFEEDKLNAIAKEKGMNSPEYQEQFKALHRMRQNIDSVDNWMVIHNQVGLPVVLLLAGGAVAMPVAAASPAAAYFMGVYGMASGAQSIEKGLATPWVPSNPWYEQDRTWIIVGGTSEFVLGWAGARAGAKMPGEPPGFLDRPIRFPINRTKGMQYPKGIPEDLGQARGEAFRDETGFNPEGTANYAESEYSIEGESGAVKSMSRKETPPGSLPPNESPLPTKMGSSGWGEFHTERQILSWFLKWTTAESRGTISLYTERAPCTACEDVIAAFKALRPNIEIVVTWGKPAITPANPKVRMNLLGP